MGEHPIDSVLSSEHLRRVLDASRVARPLPATPLRAFTVVQQRLMEPSFSESAAVDFVLVDWLTEVIAAGLCSQRQHYHLRVPEPGCSLEQALDELALDFRQRTAELEAWSLLYYRYVRVDLDLSWDHLEAVTAQDERTLRRRQERGLGRLAHELLQREREVRLITHKDRMRRILPRVSGNELIGRAAIYRRAWQILTSDTGRRLALVGPGGIGKTALAVQLASHLIDTVDLSYIAWLTPPPDMSPQDLPAYCVEVLDVPFLGEDTLRLYCQMYQVLIVLDEAEHLLERDNDNLWAFQAFWDQLVEARLIVTSRFWPDSADLPVIELPELDEQDALAVMERVWPAGYALDAARRQAIWRQAGGNPLALGIVTRLVARLPHSVLADTHLPEQFPSQLALLEGLYDNIWLQLDPEAARFWLAAWLLPPLHVTHDLVVLTSGMEPVQAAQAVHDLRQLSLLDFDAVQERYVLHSVARAYLREKVRQQEIRDWVYAASQRLRGAISESPYAAQIALHLIEQADLLAMPLSDRLELIQDAWPDMTHQGLWATYRPVLEAQVAVARQAAHLPALAFLLRALGITDRWLGRHDLAETHLQESLSLAGQTKASSDRVQVLVELAVVYRYQGRLQSAQAAAQLALSECRRLRDAEGVERCILELAQIALDQQRPKVALKRLGVVTDSARASALACNAHLLLNHLAEALTCAERAVVLAANDRPNQARAQATLGRVCLESGRLAEAEDHLALALSLLERQRDVLGWARATSTLAQVYHLEGRLDEAEALLNDSAAQQRLLGDGLGLDATLQTQLAVYAAMAEQVLEAGDETRVAELTALIHEVDSEWRALDVRRSSDQGDSGAASHKSRVAGKPQGR